MRVRSAPGFDRRKSPEVCQRVVARLRTARSKPVGCWALALIGVGHRLQSLLALKVGGTMPPTTGLSFAIRQRPLQ